MCPGMAWNGGSRDYTLNSITVNAQAGVWCECVGMWVCGGEVSACIQNAWANQKFMHTCIKVLISRAERNVISHQSEYNSPWALRVLQSHGLT